jgi:hypothetical protein
MSSELTRNEKVVSSILTGGSTDIPGTFNRTISVRGFSNMTDSGVPARPSC